jgi:membrane-associated phospholipid phosphatase
MNPKHASILILSWLLLAPVHASSKSGIEWAGDVIAASLPATAVAMTLWKRDWNGTLQFGESFLLNEAVTWTFKCTVRERRPNGEDNLSFPSSHTSISCVSAEFMRKRYGWWYGAPMYALAACAGYSRIESKHHYFHDVAAGAAIGFASGFIFSKPYRGVKVTGSAVAGRYNVRCSGEF